MALEKLNYSLSEVENLVGLGRTKLYEEINAGNLRAVKVGTRTFITKDALDSWIGRLKEYPCKMGG